MYMVGGVLHMIKKKSAIIGLIDMLFAYFYENVISSQFEIRKKYVYFLKVLASLGGRGLLAY